MKVRCAAFQRREIEIDIDNARHDDYGKRRRSCSRQALAHRLIDEESLWSECISGDSACDDKRGDYELAFTHGKSSLKMLSITVTD